MDRGVSASLIGWMSFSSRETISNPGNPPPMWTTENRTRYDRGLLRYPSDVTDEEWALIAPHPTGQDRRQQAGSEPAGQGLGVP